MHRQRATLTPGARAAFAALVLAGCTGRGDAGHAGRARVEGDACWPEPTVGSAGIGALRVGSALANLPASCALRDSITPEGLVHVVRYGARDVTVIADGAGRITRVEVRDPAFRAPGDISVGSSIATIRAVHPSLCAATTADGRIAVTADDLPRVAFETSLAAPTDPLRRRALEEDARQVPEDARVTRIVVGPGTRPCSPPAVAFSVSSALIHGAPRGRVVTDTSWSQSLGVRKELVVYLPPSYDREQGRRYPVVTLLHGLWGDQWQWVRSDHVAATMDSLVDAGLPEMILVMPDGDDGWWTTWFRLVDMRGCRAETRRHRFTPPTDPSAAEPASSYCVPWAHYDDFVARDLVAHVDSTYRTIATRDQRAIAGLSMGGYGAVSLALSYPDVFGAAASHSGVLSLLLVGRGPGAAQPREAASREELRAAWGNLWWSMDEVFGDVPGFRARDPATLAERLVRRGNSRRPALFLDVGTGDFLLEHNRAFHHRLEALGYPHHYAEWPGGHDHAYWRAHVRESLAWIGNQFAKGRR